MTTLNLQNTETKSTIYREKVSFQSGSFRLSGHLYFPNTEGGQFPAVIVTGAWTTIKEQMAGTYARELAYRGFAALAFDFTGWGESEGEPRYVEDPQVKTSDILAAVEFLAALPLIQADSIYGLGICASAGYMAEAVARNARLKKFALVAPWLHTPEIAEQVYGGAEVVNQLIEISEAEQKKPEAGVLTAASTTDETAPMFNAPYYTEPQRGLIDSYDNRFNTLTWKPWLTYNSHQSASSIEKPILMVGSDEMALPAGAIAYGEKTNVALEKFWVSGKEQFDFYDDLVLVEKVIDAISNFFNK